MFGLRLAHLKDAARRVLAAGSVLVVLVLVAGAASPRLHRWLHLGDTPHNDDQCAVVLFAAGIAPGVAASCVVAPPVMHPAVREPSPEWVFVAQPRYLRCPERGPPCA